MGTGWKAGGASARAANIYADDALMPSIDTVITGAPRLAYRPRHRKQSLPHGHLPVETTGEKGQSLFLKGFEQVEDKPLPSRSGLNARQINGAQRRPPLAFYGMGLHDYARVLTSSLALVCRRRSWPNLSPYAAHTLVHGPVPRLGHGGASRRWLHQEKS